MEKEKINIDNTPNNNKDNPFLVPENYFDNLPDSILKNIKAQKPKTKTRTVFYKYAAGFALLIAGALLFFLIHIQKPFETMETISDKPTEMFDDYIDLVLFDLSIYDIEQLILLNGYEDDDFYEKDMSEVMLNYLIENSWDDDFVYDFFE